MAVTDCRALGLGCYLPLRSATRVYQRRKVVFETPLFPGYVFAEVPLDMRGAILSRGHVTRIIHVHRPMHMLRQVAMVRKALRLDPNVEAEDPVTEGEIVRVATGPMMGCEGVVTKVMRKRGMVVLSVSVDIIGRAIPVQVERAMIERTYDPRTKGHRRAEA